MRIIPEKKCFKEPSHLLKFIVLSVCGVFTVFQVAQCVGKFIHPPTSTHSEFVLNQSLHYPCITICRRPAYKTEVLRNYGLLESIESTNAFRNFNFSRYTLDELWQTITYDFSEVIGQYAYGGIGYTSMFVNNNLSITYTFSLMRGKCFTFQPKRNSDKFSISGGYLFYLIHNNINHILDDYGVSKHGFYIYLHEPNEALSYDMDERNNFLEIIDLEAAEDMRVKFEIQEFLRIPTKQHRCISHVNYSQSKCLEMCFNDQVTRQVNCTAPFMILPEDNDLPRCSNFFSIRNLIRLYRNDRANLMANCDCPMSCNFTIYKTSIINRRNMDAQNAPNSLLSLYSTNLIFRMSEVLGYDGNQLLADVGGSLGFLLGLSVIGVICLFEEIFKLLFRCIFKKNIEKYEPEQNNNKTAEEKNVNKLETEKKQDVDVVHDYKNWNELVNGYDLNKKESEFNEHNTSKYPKY